MQRQTTQPTVASSPTWESLETWLRSTMCAGWEQIADHAEEQVGEGLMSAQQPREGVGGDGPTDDGLE